MDRRVGSGCPLRWLSLAGLVAVALPACSTPAPPAQQPEAQRGDPTTCRDKVELLQLMAQQLPPGYPPEGLLFMPGTRYPAAVDRGYRRIAAEVSDDLVVVEIDRDKFFHNRREYHWPELWPQLAAALESAPESPAYRRDLYILATGATPTVALERLRASTPPEVELRLLVLKPAASLVADMTAAIAVPAPVGELFIETVDNARAGEDLLIAPLVDEMMRIAAPCPAAIDALALIRDGAGISEVAPPLAAALAVCRCRGVDADALIALVALLMDPITELAWLPLSFHADDASARTGDQTVAELAETLAGMSPPEQERGLAYSIDPSRVAPLDSPPAPAVPPPTEPQIVPQVALEQQRIAGEITITPPDATKLDMKRTGKTRLVATIKMCLSTAGTVGALKLLRASAYPTYDQLLMARMKEWRYRPFLLNGRAVPVCTSVTFIYTQKN